jgi:hypothetical protein
MNESQKAELYGQLLNEHTRLHNKINEIKGQSIELNKSQMDEIKRFEMRQYQIMRHINEMMSR